MCRRLIQPRPNAAGRHRGHHFHVAEQVPLLSPAFHQLRVLRSGVCGVGVVRFVDCQVFGTRRGVDVLVSIGGVELADVQDVREVDVLVPSVELLFSAGVCAVAQHQQDSACGPHRRRELAAGPLEHVNEHRLDQLRASAAVRSQFGRSFSIVCQGVDSIFVVCLVGGGILAARRVGVCVGKSNRMLEDARRGDIRKWMRLLRSV